jgi:hypothetical protein
MPEVQDIFTRYGEEYYKSHLLTPEQYKVLRSIINCRTSALGGHVDECEECGSFHISFNSCRNRHCPKCQSFLKAKWIDARKAEVLPVPYYHVIFTVPEELNPVIFQNQKVMYKILFDVVAATLLELTADPEHLGALIGFAAFLHTWGQNLLFHPHIHCLVPSGGLSPENKFIIGNDKFFVHVNILSEIFQKKFLQRLKEAYADDQLKFHRSIADYADRQCFQDFVNSLYLKSWVVHCKESFNGSEAVLEYLGRYTYRVCISNNRILGCEDGNVTFKWKDYRDGETKEMTVTAAEFIRRFLLHVLPTGFMKIRYYGLMSNRNRSTLLKTCQQLARYEPRQAQFKELPAVEIIKILTGKDVTLCPVCQKGRLRTIRTITRGISPPLVA